MDANKIASAVGADTAKAEGDKSRQELQEGIAIREKANYEKEIGQPNRPPLVIHLDGSVGGPGQEGDVKVPQ